MGVFSNIVSSWVTPVPTRLRALPRPCSFHTVISFLPRGELGFSALQFLYSFAPHYTVTESGVQLIAAQKPITRQVGGKEALLYFGCQQPVGRANACLKADSLPLTVGGRSFYRQRQRATCRNSTVSSDSHLKVCHWWSDQHHPDCFKYS